MDHKNCIILLTGFPGSGKLTTAELLAEQHQFKLLANYHVNKLVFDLVEKDVETTPPEYVWDRIEILWNTIFETIQDFSPPNFNFVITRPLIHGMAYSENFYNKVTQLAKRRNNIFAFIRLECDESELVKRIQSEKRKTLGKVINPNRAKYLIQHHQVFSSNQPHEITINNTHHSHAETVKRIMTHIRNLGFKE